MKKKIYEAPRIDIVFIHDNTPLLAGSVMFPGGDNEPPGSRMEYYYDDDW